MAINWRDMLSMISSPDPFELPLFSQPGLFFSQQVGVSIFLPLEAEEFREINAVASAMMTAVKKRRFSFFMVVVLQFDETIGENVTANLKFVGRRGKGKLTNSRIGEMEWQKQPLNCFMAFWVTGQLHLSIFA